MNTTIPTTPLLEMLPIQTGQRENLLSGFITQQQVQ